MKTDKVEQEQLELTDKVVEEQSEDVPLAAETHLTQEPVTPKGEESEDNTVEQHHHSILNNRTTRLTIYISILMIFVFPSLITECYILTTEFANLNLFVGYIHTEKVSQREKVTKLFISAYSIILAMNVTTGIFLWDLIPGIKLSEYINIKLEDLLHTVIKSIIGFLYIIGGILIFVAVVKLSIIENDQEEHCLPCFLWATYFYIMLGSAYLGVDIMIDTFSKTQNRLIAYSFMICLCSALSVAAISSVVVDVTENGNENDGLSMDAMRIVSQTGGIILTVGSFFILVIATRICGKLFYISRICGFIVGIGTIFSVYLPFFAGSSLLMHFMVIILLYCFVLVYDTQFIIHVSIKHIKGGYKKPATEVENAEHDELDERSEIDLKKNKSPMDNHSTRMCVYLSIVVIYSLSNIIWHGIWINEDKHAENILISGYAFCFISCFPLIYVYFNLFSESIRNIISIICAILLLIGVILLFVGNGISINDLSKIGNLFSSSYMWGCVLFLLIPSIFVAVDMMFPFIGNDIVWRICAYSITYIISPIMLLVEYFTNEGITGDDELLKCAQAGLIICVIFAALSVTVSIVSKYTSVSIGLLQIISLVFGLGILLSIPWFWNPFILGFYNLVIFCYISFAGLNCLELVYLRQN